MKKIFYCVAFMVLSIESYAQGPDLNVVASPAVGGSMGVLSISISLTYSPPFTLVITGPNGFVLNANITENTHVLWNLPPGEYCVSVTNATGCTASLCIKIKKCTIITMHGTTYVSCIDDAPSDPDPTVVYARGMNSTISPPLHNYDLTTSSSLTTMDVNQIFFTIDEVTNLINQVGYSIYDVESQTEIESEGYDFVFKFVNNEIVWVHHNTSFSERNKIIEHLVVGDQYYKIVPNPASNQINVVFSSDDFAEFRLHIFDASGSLIKSNIVPTSKEFQIETINLPSGLYFLKSNSSEGQITTKFTILK